MATVSRALRGGHAFTLIKKTVLANPSSVKVTAEPAPAPRAVRTDRAATLGSSVAATVVTTRL